MTQDVPSSAVEKHLLATSRFSAPCLAPTEKQRVYVLDNFPALGKAGAFRFLEWAQHNPHGVCSLPTGKTPEFFIKWVRRVLTNWASEDIQAELKAHGLDHTKKPDLWNLTFVQIDEFYPIAPEQQNSFSWYVKEFYIKGFGMDPAKALLMDGLVRVGLDGQQGYGTTGEPEDHIAVSEINDVWPEGHVDLTLRAREPETRLERLQQRVLREVDQWCAEYERKIRELGGIGFIMGGIGPDGHVAFNCRGCDHFSTTRLDQLNYPSQAAASTDLGGIDAVRRRKVVTIGLGTITANPECVALVCAAGEAKAQVVRDAIEEAPHVKYPATALQKLRNSAFYVTEGAGKLLLQRQVEDLRRLETIPETTLHKVLINLSVQRRKKLLDLSSEDVATCPLATSVMEKVSEELSTVVARVRDTLIEKIEKGTKTRDGTRFLHTEPHHDDIMLGYLPAVLRNTRSASNSHHFMCATSGFNSVSNKHMLLMLARVERFLQTPTFVRLCTEGYFGTGSDEKVLEFRRRDVWKFLDGVAANDNELRDEGAARRLVANMCIIYEIVATAEGQALMERVHQLQNYFQQCYAGEKDVHEVQILKGACREFEAECVWGFLGWQIPDISHLRLGFYTADIFAPEPTQSRDVEPILRLLHDKKPDVVSVALDPEASGPDTHYKVLQAVTAAVEQYVGAEEENGQSEEDKRNKMTVWGYRNVWFRFEPHEVSTIIPVSMQSISTSNHMFLNSFESQREAEFPAPDIQGPFCDMSQRVQVQQYEMIKAALGYDWFHNHPSPLIRATRGLVFLREMSVAELLRESRAIRKHAENAE